MKQKGHICSPRIRNIFDDFFCDTIIFDTHENI